MAFTEERNQNYSVFFKKCNTCDKLKFCHVKAFFVEIRGR